MSSVDLSKLTDVAKNDVVQKTVYDKLVAKVNNIDTSDFSTVNSIDTKLNIRQTKQN